MRIVVVPHDSGWAGKFSRESQRVAEALTPTVVAIHHIGSTAIPKIHAKPVIDMLVEVTALHQVDLRETAMLDLGYEGLGECGLPGRRYFRKSDDAGFREYQVHAFLAGTGEITRHLAFRDYLQAHPDRAQQYSDLKRELARLHPQGIDGYMEGKDAFVKEMERRALRWQQESRDGRP